MDWCTLHSGWALLRMSASKHIQGYSCEFLDSVSDDFCCMRCSLVARKLSITSCCGETYCHACIADTQQQGKPCPACGENEFSITQLIKFQKKLNEFLVYCSLKERGCGWSGPLKELDSHLDPDQDNCQYVDMKCPLNCQQIIPKNQVEQHVAQECTKREYVCQYCNFKATYEEVVSIHFPECKYVPLQCPNLCGVTFERDFMEDHMKMCRLEEVGCEFDGVGCEERLTREEQEEHTRQNSQTHLILTASLAAKTNKNLLDWSAEDKEEKKLLKQKVEEQQKTLKSQEQKLNKQEQKMKDQNLKIKNQEQKIKDQEQKTKGQEQMIKNQKHSLGEQKLLLRGLEQSMQQLRSLVQDSQEQKLKEQEQMIKDQELKIKDQELTLGEQKLLLGGLEQSMQQLRSLVQDSQEQKMKDQEQKTKYQEQKIKDQELTLGEQKLLLSGLKQSMQQLRSLVQYKDKKQEAECGRLEQKLREQQLTLLYLCHGLTNAKMRYFLMANFSKEKAKDKIDDWWSPAMYTHDGGYKFCIGVDANGYLGGHGKAIRVKWKLMEGEYDDQLKWPAKAATTLELVNQDGGMNLAHTLRFPLEKTDLDAYLFSRIFVGGNRHFVKHSELDPFLVNDTLIFYISNITMI